MKEIKFQTKFITKIVDTSVDLLNDKYQEEGTIVFQAPTGSGKTYMISQALAEIVKRINEPLAFIWISVNSLHEQSLKNLSRYFEEEKLLECIAVEEILDNEIDENQIVFFNWESLIKTNNVFRFDNERDWNLKTVAQNTREEGRRIVLIIDESHRTATAQKAKDVIAEINPALTIEMTATPLEVSGTLIKIPLMEVIVEGMIKKEVVINPFTAGASLGAEDDLLDAALLRRTQLKKAYARLGQNINPLLLIQVPNARPGDAANPEDHILGLLADRNYSVRNGNLAIWLSDKKENRDELELPTSPIDVLIFKEAIAVGWDCPRAAILYLQREWKDHRYSFNMQTLGRIMRMPEQMHYSEEEDLNIGYVYTASNSFDIVKELAVDYVSSLQMARDENIYDRPIKLTSEFIRRKVERTSLSGDFKQCFSEAAIELNLKANINEKVKEVQRKIKVEGRVGNIDVQQSVEFEREYAYRLSVKQTTDEYVDLIGKQTSPYMPKRSAKFMKSSIRSWFKASYGIADEDQVAQIVIQGNNRPKFLKVIEVAKEKYGQLPSRDDEIVVNEEWEVPEATTIFKSNYIELEPSAKSILKERKTQTMFVKKNLAGKAELFTPELMFVEQLEKTDSETQWWFKNGTKDSKYFGIAFKKPDGFLSGFYPDFIVKTKKEVLIIEIKDDNALDNENWRKYNAGKDYLKKYEQKEKLRFYMLSPDDYDNFFLAVKNQNLDEFNSVFEGRLLLHAKSEQKILESKENKTEEDNELLRMYELELDKIVGELKDAKLRNEILELDLVQAYENLKAVNTSYGKEDVEKIHPLEITKPFNICVLGEVSDKTEISKELNKYFAKLGILTTDWNIEYFNNTKLQNSNVLRSLHQGQSKFNVIVTGQIFHHSGKGNEKANILSELKNDKYIPHCVGSNPKDLLTADKLIEVIDKYLKAIGG